MGGWNGAIGLALQCDLCGFAYDTGPFPRNLAGVFPLYELKANDDANDSNLQ
jgi:hypothetical protein